MTNKKMILTYTYRAFIALIISFVLGISIYVMNVKRVTGNKLFMPFDKTIAVVLTGSMRPNILESDLIVIEKTNDYGIDDVVVFQDGNQLIVHRIVKIEGEEITTAGDANDGSTDKPIVKEQIYGEVVDVIPYLGLLLKAVKSPIVIIVITSIAVYLLALSYKKEEKKENEEIIILKEEIEKLKKELNS